MLVRLKPVPRARRGALPIAVVVVAAAFLLALVSSAPASAESPWWHLTSGSRPSVLPTEGEGTVVVSASNLSALEIDGSGEGVTLTDTLPAGLSVISIEGGRGEPLECSSSTIAGSVVVLCTFNGVLLPYQLLEVRIKVKLGAGAVSGALNRMSLSGGGAPSVSASRPIAIGSGGTPFGVEQYELTAENADGSPATQAGAHPFQLTDTLFLNSGPEIEFPEAGGQPHAVLAPALAKDFQIKLPPGLIADPNAFPRCAATQFSVGGNGCPVDTQIGVARVTAYEPSLFGLFTETAPLYNLVPARGEPARFGFIAAIFPVVIDTSIRTGGDYGVTATVPNITELPTFLAGQVTFWGDPGDPRHDGARGECLRSSDCTSSEGAVNAPFLTMPSQCGNPSSEPLESSVSIDSWADPSALTEPLVYKWHDGSGAPLALDGCNKLGFEPSFSATPDGTSASTPTGLTTTIKVPQETILTPQGLAQSDVKETTFVLPEGMQLSPAAADGLMACSPGEIALGSAGPPTCPEASKVATVELKTPLLPEALNGALYLASQDENPFGSLVALYLFVEDPTEGVVVKLAGSVSLDPVTGQITAVFPDNPPLPFSELRAHFFGSDRAPLSTPSACGSYRTSASFVPWSGSPPAQSSSTFQITSGPDGTSCADPRPFNPGFEAGMTSIQAGGYSPLTVTMDHPDADQTLSRLSIQMPPGLLGALSHVKLCEEPQAAAGTCGAESLIGHVTASAGLGGDPFTVEGGQVFITGPYGGAPFGLSIVEPAVAGPFNLGTIVVRAKIEVDPTDAHLTIVSDPLPTIRDGIPLQIQHVNVLTNRPEFTFDPTSCNPMKITAVLESSEGAIATVSNPFQVTNCASLAFQPKLTVSTSAKTSRTEGASLHVGLTLPAQAGEGTEANVAKVKVSLPKQLPSPLKTLQKACTEKVFAENPASCPKASRVGEATVTTPVLEGPLTGPAYFVSHGGAKYPELIIVLTGEDGVTVQVHGETFISKQGITTATFATVPDVPFSTFELTLPEREYPALSANGNLCKAQANGKLLMPTEIVGQNGLKITQSTKISVTGCPATKHKKATKHNKAKHPKKRRKR